VLQGHDLENVDTYMGAGDGAMYIQLPKVMYGESPARIDRSASPITVELNGRALRGEDSSLPTGQELIMIVLLDERSSSY
jgi:hypothetical protein